MVNEEFWKQQPSQELHPLASTWAERRRRASEKLTKRTSLAARNLWPDDLVFRHALAR
jgi:hypothetical protein